MLDDIDSVFPLRTKLGMLKKLNLAAKKGIYPGWESDIENSNSKRKVLPEGPLKPRPILKKDGSEVKSRRRKAASQLGRHFIPTLWDTLDGVDLYSRVTPFPTSFFVYVPSVY